MIQLIDAVPLRAFDWAGYELTQHAQHAADVHADRLTTYGSYDVHDNELTGGGRGRGAPDRARSE